MPKHGSGCSSASGGGIRRARPGAPASGSQSPVGSSRHKGAGSGRRIARAAAPACASPCPRADRPSRHRAGSRAVHVTTAASGPPSRLRPQARGQVPAPRGNRRRLGASRRALWSTASPSDVSSVRPARTRTSPSPTASSQIERRGQLVRQTSIVSRYVRGVAAIHASRSRVSGVVSTGSA